MGQVEAVPEQLRGARLAAEPRGEVPEHLVGEAQDRPPASHRVGVVAVVDRVVRERRAIAEIERSRLDGDVNPELAQSGEEVAVELRAGQALAQREAGLPPPARAHAQAVADEVELDLPREFAARQRAGREPARRDVQRDVPPMVPKRHERHPNLAHDLRVAMERLLRRLPVPVGQLRPAKAIAHAGATRSDRSVASIRSITAGK